jgi:hypothetical protein
MDKEYLQQLLMAVNQSQREGASRQDIDELLTERFGLTVESIQQQLAADPFTPEPVEGVRGGDVVAGALQGASFGLLDDFLIAAGAMPQVAGGQGLAMAGEGMRERVERFRREEPGQAFLSEVLGGFLVPGLGTATLVKAAGGGAIARLLANIGVGGVSGALAGAGEAEELGGERGVLPRAAMGAAMGAAGGAALTGLGGAGRLVRGAARKVEERVAPERAGRRMAESLIEEAARDVGMTQDEFTRMFAEAQARRPGLVVPMDVSDAFQRLQRAQANMARGSYEDINRMLSARVEGAGERLAEDLGELSGFAGRTAREAQEAATVARRVRTEDMWARIDAGTPFDVNMPEFQALMNHPQYGPDFRRIWANVLKEFGNEPTDMRHVQRLWQDLRDAKDAAFNSRNPWRGHRIKDAMLGLDDVLADVSDDFRAANLGYKQNSEVIRAFDAGADAYKQGTTPQRTAEIMAEIAGKAGPLADEAVEAFRHGIVDRAISQMVKPAARGRNVGRQMLRVAQGQSALRNAFKDPADLEEFIARAMLEDRLTITRNLQIGNSSTIAQRSGLLRVAQNAQVQGPMAAFFRALNEPSPETVRVMASIITEVLSHPSPNHINQLLSILSRADVQQAMSKVGLAASTVVGEQLGAQVAPQVGTAAYELIRTIQEGAPSDVTAMQPNLLGAPRRPTLGRRNP